MSVDGVLATLARIIAGLVILSIISGVVYGLFQIGERGMLLLSFVAVVVMICWMIGTLVLGDDF